MQAQMRLEAPVEQGFSSWADVPVEQQGEARAQWAEAQQDARDGKFDRPVTF